jgi:hypothetical protein
LEMFWEYLYTARADTQTKTPPDGAGAHRRLHRLASMAAFLGIRTAQELEARPEQRALAIDRHHRNLLSDARSLELAIMSKRAELERCSLRVGAIQSALAAREDVLAHPVPRQLKAARGAAHALYDSLTAEPEERPADA